MVFTIFFGNKESGEGVSFSVSNMRTLSKKAGVKYSELTTAFTRQKRKYYETDKGYIIVKSEIFWRGRGRGKVPGKRGKSIEDF